MLSNAQIVPTIPVTDVDRARAFYEQKLGLQQVHGVAPEGAIAYACGKGSVLVLYHRGPTNPQHTLAGFIVPDLHAEVAELRARGVVFEEYDYPGLKTESGIAHVSNELAAWLKDPDGNIIGISQIL